MYVKGGRWKVVEKSDERKGGRTVKGRKGCSGRVKILTAVDEW